MTAIRILVDADACPVKDEIYKVAWRHGVPVTIVSNSPFRVPDHPLVSRVIVSDAFDAADDWIAERVGPGAIVVTADVPLASRCVRAGATVLSPTGKPFSDASIGMALATRNLMQDLREAGMVTGGPKPFSARDRSAFLGVLDQAIRRATRDLGKR